jgi:hypothetical protein
MSTSKARFQPNNSGVPKTAKSSVVGSGETRLPKIIQTLFSSPINFIAGSKRVGATVGPTTGGFAGPKSSHVQVIYHGKILTPQSLLVRKSHTSHAPGEFRENKHKAVDKSFATHNQTIDEAASDNADSKPVAAKLPFKKCGICLNPFKNH